VWFTIKYPLITLKIISLIHWHALKLYLKKVRWFAKAARPDAQRDLYRPHISIANPPKHEPPKSIFSHFCCGHAPGGVHVILPRRSA
jgi:hypothetical protein